MRTFAAVLMILLASVTFSGCGSDVADPVKGPAADGADPPAQQQHDAATDDPDDSDMEKMKAELAKLAPEEAAAAEEQHMCPVSGKMLGSMGAPIKVDVEGRPVWICCEGCREPLLETPDEYLAKLKQ